MAVSVSRWKYRVTYQNYLGGITLMNPTVFITIRGFSNKFWGWGGEDDDLYCRLVRFESVFMGHPVTLFFADTTSASTDIQEARLGSGC